MQRSETVWNAVPVEWMVLLDSDVEQPAEGAIFVDMTYVPDVYVAMERFRYPESASVRKMLQLLRKDRCSFPHAEQWC